MFLFMSIHSELYTCVIKLDHRCTTLSTISHFQWCHPLHFIVQCVWKPWNTVTLKLHKPRCLSFSVGLSLPLVFLHSTPLSSHSSSTSLIQELANFLSLFFHFASLCVYLLHAYVSLFLCGTVRHPLSLSLSLPLSFWLALNQQLKMSQQFNFMGAGWFESDLECSVEFELSCCLQLWCSNSQVPCFWVLCKQFIDSVISSVLTERLGEKKFLWYKTWTSCKKPLQNTYFLKLRWSSGPMFQRICPCFVCCFLLLLCMFTQQMPIAANCFTLFHWSAPQSTKYEYSLSCSNLYSGHCTSMMCRPIYCGLTAVCFVQHCMILI